MVTAVRSRAQLAACSSERCAHLRVMGQLVEDPALHGRLRVFRDRTDAGEALARLLRTLPLEGSVLLAVPAGGVPVAVAARRALGWPLDVAVVSKLTLPWNREAGFGAVAFDGSVLLHEDLIAQVALSQADIAAAIASTRRKVERRVLRLRANREPLLLHGKTAVLVDDGLASGFTMKAAVCASRALGARSIVAATPTGHTGAIARVLSEVTYVVCPNVRAGPTFAVADAYEDWRDVPEVEAELILERELGSGSSP